MSEAMTIQRERLVLGYVAGATVDEPFAYSLVRLWFHEQKKPEAERVIFGVARSCGLYVEDNRAKMASEFLAGPANLLLTIDTDMEFPPELPEHMADLMALNPQIGILAVNVPLNGARHAGFSWDADTHMWDAIDPLPAEPMFECDGVATCITIFRRSCLESIEQMFGKGSAFERIHVGKARDERAGEDLSVCWRAKQAGQHVYLMRYPSSRGHVRHWKRRALVDDTSDVFPQVQVCP